MPPGPPHHKDRQRQPAHVGPRGQPWLRRKTEYSAPASPRGLHRPNGPALAGLCGREFDGQCLVVRWPSVARWPLPDADLADRPPRIAVHFTPAGRCPRRGHGKRRTSDSSPP
jgi:hypothetical protein